MLLFTVLQTLTGQTPAWGIITGVHPVKLLRQKSEEVGLLSAEAFFRDKWLVSDGKIALMRRVLQVQEPYVALSNPIVAAFIYGAVLPQPVFLLFVYFSGCGGREKTHRAVCDAAIAGNRGNRRHCPAGGLAGAVGIYRRRHPTTFSASQLTAVIEKVRERFDLSHCVEFTVEAGRPDTVTKEKLQALLSGGVTRISINPQSMHNDVLRPSAAGIRWKTRYGRFPWRGTWALTISTWI